MIKKSILLLALVLCSVDTMQSANLSLGFTFNAAASSFEVNREFNIIQTASNAETAANNRYRLGDHVTTRVTAQTSTPSRNHKIGSDNKLETDETKTLLNKYLELESRNTPNAKLQLSLILSNCSQFSDENLKAIDESIESGDMDLIFLREMKRKLVLGNKKCVGVFDHLPGSNFNELSLAWLEDAAAEGHPVAQLESLYRYPDDPKAEDVLPLLYQSLELTKTEPELLQTVYNRLLFYYSDHVEVRDTSSDGYRGAERDAWDYLACSNADSDACDIEVFLEQYRTSFFEHQAEAMFKRAEELQGYIDSSDWESLNLVGNP